MKLLVLKFQVGKPMLHAPSYLKKKLSTEKELEKNCLPKSFPNPDCLKPPNGAATSVLL